MFRGWLQLGQTEIANSGRTIAYMKNGVRNLSTEIVTDDSWPMLPVWLDRESVWQRPELDDDCPWYDSTESASAEFAGVWPMSVEGADSTPVDREVVEGAIAGGGFGVLRTPPRTLTVEALVIASTPAGLRYGLGWLGSALRGEACEDGGEPRQLLFLDSAPPMDAQMDEAEVRAMADAEVRMLSQVVLTGEVTVDEMFSPWVHENRGATAARVTFELTAGVPWIWRMPMPLVSGLQPALGESQTVTFESADEDGNFPSGCLEETSVLTDPARAPLATLPRPLTPAAALSGMPLESRRLTWQLEAGRVPRWAETLATVTVRTGPVEERSIRLQWVQGGAATARDISCNTVGEAMIGYVPANSTFTLDAVTGSAEVITSDGRRLDGTPVVTGRQGGPWRPPILRCSQPYTLVIDTDETVNPQVRIDVDAVVRQP